MDNQNQEYKASKKEKIIGWFVLILALGFVVTTIVAIIDSERDRKEMIEDAFWSSFEIKIPPREPTTEHEDDFSELSPFAYRIIDGLRDIGYTPNKEFFDCVSFTKGGDGSRISADFYNEKSLVIKEVDGVCLSCGRYAFSNTDSIYKEICGSLLNILGVVSDNGIAEMDSVLATYSEERRQSEVFEKNGYVYFLIYKQRWDYNATLDMWFPGFEFRVFDKKSMETYFDSLDKSQYVPITANHINQPTIYASSKVYLAGNVLAVKELPMDDRGLMWREVTVQVGELECVIKYDYAYYPFDFADGDTVEVYGAIDMSGCINDIVAKQEIPACHIWQDATCTMAKKCLLCGIAEGSALGHTTDNDTCERCGFVSMEPVTYSGSGDQVITGVAIPKGFFKVTISHTGNNYFSVHAYNRNGDSTSLASVVGQYTGATILNLNKAITKGQIDVKADGDWQITVETINDRGTSNLKGQGDCVSPFFELPGGKLVVKISHDGDRYFAVRVYNDKGEWIESLASEIGEYTGEVVFEKGEPGRLYFVRVISGKSDQGVGSWSVDFGIDDTVTDCTKE